LFLKRERMVAFATEYTPNRAAEQGSLAPRLWL